MKRLSKVQQEIEGLAPKLPAISNEQYEWAKTQINYFVQIAQGTTYVRCPNCGHTYSMNDAQRVQSRWNKEDNTYTCPDCGAHTQVRIIPAQLRSSSDRKQKDIVYRHKQDDFFQVMNVVGDWQVIRLVYMRRYVYVRKPSTDWEFYEVCQSWNNPKYDKTYFRAYAKCMMSSYQFCPYSLNDWQVEKNEDGTYKYDENGNYKWYAQDRRLEPRMPNGSNYFRTDNVAPKAQILPYYKRIGNVQRICKEIKMDMMQLFQDVAQSKVGAMHETLIKAKEYAIYKHIRCGVGKLHPNEFFSAWKICQRNHYTPKTSRMWIDLVDMLISLGLDCHNAHYVCPKDLREFHNEIEARERARQRREWERERNERMLALAKAEEDAERKFNERIVKYRDINIHKGDLTIIVLPTIDAFKEEGEHLGHCVYSCGYYKKEDSLILSARDSKSGKRWETIEVGISDLMIRQCYGYADKFSVKHKEILALMKDNLWQVKERRDAGQKRIAC